METARTRANGRSLATLTTVLVLALLTTLLLADTALGVARPGRPTAKAPKSTISSARPTFSWSKASRATSYEVRAYKGNTLLLKKTGITRLSWKAAKALPKNVGLTWKVRARNSAGNGAGSSSLKFKVALKIGDSYQGGKVAYIFQSGDPGYAAGQTHGLIAAAGDIGLGAQWSNLVSTLIGRTGTALGTGWANTEAIVYDPPGVTSAAAYLCDHLGDGGHDDWSLSSKVDANFAWLQNFSDGSQGASDKSSSVRVPGTMPDVGSTATGWRVAREEEGGALVAP